MTTQTCARCGATAPPHFVACPKCHALFYAETLGALLKQTDEKEAQGDFVGALEHLRAMEPLLPHQSTQATAVRTRIAALEPKAAQQPGGKKSGTAPGWVAGIGAAVVALLTKGKFLLLGLTKLPTLLSFFVSAALWRGSSGLAAGLVVLGSIYVHEMGHIFAFRRYAIAVTPPMFVPGFGAFVRGAHYPRALSAIGDVALSGPLWGGATGVVLLGLGVALQQPWLLGVALIVAEVNLFNLVPVWQLDGSRATACLSKAQLLVLGVLSLIGAAVAGSPMAAAVGVGLIVRRWVRAPEGDGDVRTFRLFLGLLVGLLALRVGAMLLVDAVHVRESVS